MHRPDLHVANLLIDGGGRLYLIDFDRGGKNAPEWLLSAGFARLRRSLRKYRDAPKAIHYDDVADWRQLEAGYRATRRGG